MIDGVSGVCVWVLSVRLYFCFQERAGDLRLLRVAWGREDYTTV